LSPSINHIWGKNKVDVIITKAKAMLEQKKLILNTRTKKGKGVVQRKKMVHDKKK
jgi:hypothetical protein